MNKLYGLVALLVLMTGCSYKNEAIELSSYKMEYLIKTTQDVNNISFLSVTDAREEKKSIGFVSANGEKTVKLFSNVNFADKYKEGLTNALRVAKFNLVKDSSNANTKIEVKIKDIQLMYNDTNKFDQNLNGKIVVEVALTKADKVKLLTFTQEQGTWIKPSYTSKDIEPLLYTLFTDNINDIVAKLAVQ